ncbi:hypothetical protein BSY19_5075 (plasmid) [Bosea sp. RAC05]|nr:hypothetical protein BSY19_5075 [Bosea sp. RAC05]
MIVYHGTNAELAAIKAGSWVTTDIDAARSFAVEKTAEAGGIALVAAIDIDEAAIDWDALGAVAGVEDERGTLLRQAAVMTWSEVRPGPGGP